jgi:malate dehydrogenase
MPQFFGSVYLSAGGSVLVSDVVRTAGESWEIVQSLPLNDFSRDKISASINELKQEKSLVSDLLRSK